MNSGILKKGREDIILDSVNEGVFTVDPDWRVTSFNRAAERITGIPREEALGRPCSEVFRASICETRCALRETLSRGKPVVNASAHISDHRGTRIPIRISTALLRDESGSVIGGVETFQDQTRIEELQKEIQAKYTFEDIVGHSSVMRGLFEILPQIAESSSTVLIEGPSGTGKELFARAIHNLSPRRKKAFLPVNCAALPDTLLESELFGHRAGAFTDARSNKPGRFELANEGTIFLDEIGDISPAMQVRLLRVLQDRIVEPLGGTKPVPVNVRVVAATNRDLAALVRAGTFRDDLYYRIRVISLKLPPLRERREDIPLLIERFITRLNRIQGKEIEGVSPEVMLQLMEHPYPGNVRELENILEHAFVLCRERIIQLNHLPPELRPANELGGGRTPSMSLSSMERYLITGMLDRCRGNRREAARLLGIDVSTLYRKIRSLRIAVPERDGRGNRNR